MTPGDSSFTSYSPPCHTTSCLHSTSEYRLPPSLPRQPTATTDFMPQPPLPVAPTVSCQADSPASPGCPQLASPPIAAYILSKLDCSLLSPEDWCENTRSSYMEPKHFQSLCLCACDSLLLTCSLHPLSNSCLASASLCTPRSRHPFLFSLQVALFSLSQHLSHLLCFSVICV